MKTKLLIMLGVAAVCHALPGLAASNDAENCDRACLRGLLDTYREAIVTHDPEAAPLMTGYRQTENAKVMRLGSGVWETATAFRTGNDYLDPVNGQALWFGVMDEGATPTVAMVRIKVAEREIVEAEWFISRPGMASMQGPPDAPGSRANLHDPEGIMANPPPVRVVPEAERLSRLSLTGIANSYFDGLTTHDGSLIMAHPDCFRRENGLLVTGRPLAEGRNDGHEGKTNCASGMGTFNMSLVADRRFFIMDEEQQVAVTSAIFMRNANGQERRCVFIELFYIDENLISQIYSVIYYPDPNLPVPNWEPYQGNFPLPESFGAAR